jgi:hypothetical protein
MLSHHLSRRAFVAWSSAAAGVWLSTDIGRRGVRAAPFAVTPRPGEPVLQILNAPHAADLDSVTSLIIPTDDAPGAREAGVVHFIDNALATWAASQRDLFIAGLNDLARRANGLRPGVSFSQLDAASQLSLLRDIESTPFFQAARFATLAGMFSDPSHGGNKNAVGWHLIGFEQRHAWQPPFGFYDASPEDRSR